MQQDRVAVIGSGIAGLITAYTLLRDGFDVEVLTRDALVGGIWAKDKIYPGLYINNVHGEYRLSPLEMPPPVTQGVVGGRLTGEDINKYLETFTAKFLQGKIRYRTEVRNLLDGPPETLDYDRLILCTGGSSAPQIPEELSPKSAESSGYKGLLFHSADFNAKLKELLETVRPIEETSSVESASVVVVGGGKSAQDISAYLANEGRKVTVVFEEMDAFTAGPKPLPAFIRKSRLLALFSPHIHLRTILERFLHTTWLGSKIVKFMWHGLQDSSFQAAHIPKGSPLRRTVSPYWHIRVNDEGVPRENGFHALAVAGKIDVIAPARVAAFGDDGRSVRLNDGRKLRADALVLATGYESSWPAIFDETTLDELGLKRRAVNSSEKEHHWNYTSLAAPPKAHSEGQNWSTSLYRALVPASQFGRGPRDFAVNGAIISPNNGYTVEVASHWISSYFLGDEMRLPSTAEQAHAETDRNSAWLKQRYPSIGHALNESHTSSIAFWSWPQHIDDLLEDMRLPVMRSGGNWLTWPFKVIDMREIQHLKEERDARRRKTR